MKIALALIVLTTLVLSNTPAQAKYPPDGDGVAGRVRSVAFNYFICDTNYGRVKVSVSANTHFQVDGQPDSPNVIKEGVAIRVTAHITADHIWEAYKCNVTDK